ncbi:SfnB family sulfur acquisition oxidoreductase [Nocardioides gansuensis]|uniref:Dibenzothiophene monooxygenase n=1 Tax=Nocardioides gansuensis TaxID=2138300 RepID=A0A2T8F8H4_9ACTN|nr:SfnB family sulfur acquisition oxidoreductase [Nocardioides gansuensis]PVG82031.1 SfnB family sulfur acquisition oxidoreductase [Nocardioides gansuensis]
MSNLSIVDEPTTEGHAARIRDAGHALAVATTLAARFAERASERDRDRRLPHVEIGQLADSGLLAITVPAEYGGIELPPSTVAEVLARLAATDANIAQIPHSHFVYANLLRVAGSEAQRERLFSALLAGKVMANAQSERGGKDVTDIATTLTADQDGRLRLDGTKYYCTGTLFADVVPVLARLDDPHQATDIPEGDVIVLLPAVVDGIAIRDDWDAVGQRCTASGTVVLEAVQVSRDWVVPRHRAFDSPNGYGAFAQLMHAAIDVGIARGALEAAAEFVRTSARPWFEAEVERAVDDPLTVQRMGELSVEVTVAEAVLERAGRAVDRVFDAPTEAHAVAASLEVAAAKVVSERASLAVSTGLFEVGGTRAAAGRTRLDRFWRNARTHTLHDPSRWKLQHLGRHVLTGQRPPVHGVI